MISTAHSLRIASRPLRGCKKRQNVHPAPFCHCGRKTTARKALGRDIQAATGAADIDPSVAPPKIIAILSVWRDQ